MSKATTNVIPLNSSSSTHASRLSQTACAGCREQKAGPIFPVQVVSDPLTPARFDARDISPFALDALEEDCLAAIRHRRIENILLGNEMLGKGRRLYLSPRSVMVKVSTPVASRESLVCSSVLILTEELKVVQRNALRLHEALPDPCQS